MLCEEVAEALPSIMGGDSEAAPQIVAHVETCLACHAELARYRKLLRMLRGLRSQQVEVPPGLLADVLEALGSAAERSAVRSALRGRRLAYGSGAALTLGIAAAVVVLAHGRSARVRATSQACEPDHGAIV